MLLEKWLLLFLGRGTSQNFFNQRSELYYICAHTDGLDKGEVFAHFEGLVSKEFFYGTRQRDSLNFNCLRGIFSFKHWNLGNYWEVERRSIVFIVLLFQQQKISDFF